MTLKDFLKDVGKSRFDILFPVTNDGTTYANKAEQWGQFHIVKKGDSNPVNKWKLPSFYMEYYTKVLQTVIPMLEAEPAGEYDFFINRELNAYVCQEIIESLGYEASGIETNGWQLDFSVTFRKDDKYLFLSGTGVTGELSLSTISAEEGEIKFD
jgi:hypothetical protein